MGLAGVAGSTVQSVTRHEMDWEEVPSSQPLACCSPPLPEVRNARGGADSSPRVKHHVGGTPDQVRQLPHLPLHFLRRVKNLSRRDKPHGNGEMQGCILHTSRHKDPVNHESFLSTKEKKICHSLMTKAFNRRETVLYKPSPHRVRAKNT